MAEIFIGNLDALQLAQTARAQQTEVESDTGSTLRLGPVADELAAIDPRLVTVATRVTGVDEDGEAITVSTALVDTANVAGLAWAAAAVEPPSTSTASGRFDANQCRTCAAACGWVNARVTSAKLVPGRT